MGGGLAPVKAPRHLAVAIRLQVLGRAGQLLGIIHRLRGATVIVPGICLFFSLRGKTWGWAGGATLTT